MAGRFRKTFKGRRRRPNLYLKYGKRKRAGGIVSKRKRGRLSRRKPASKAIFRKIRKLSKRISHIPRLMLRKWQLELSVGSIGVSNAWKYRVIDTMFASDAGGGVVANPAYGWNMITTLAAAGTRLSANAGQAVGQVVKFTGRRMTTMFQAPTQTPTFVEVYLLKPLLSGKFGDATTTSLGIGHPLWLGTTGTVNGTNPNPGALNGMEITLGSADPLKAYHASASSLLQYNPFSDRSNMKARFKVTKKWKFILGPTTSKVITLKSSKPFTYDGSIFQPGTGSTVAGATVSSPYEFMSKSRIMVVRWHGFNCLSSVASPSSGLLYSGTTADPIVIKRWFEFSGYTQDNTAYQPVAFDNAGLVEADISKFQYFGPANYDAAGSATGNPTQPQ